MYECFNARDIGGVLAAVADDVAWANGMDGGHVHGHEAVRDYWTRQRAVVSPPVEPIAFRARPTLTPAIHSSPHRYAQPPAGLA
ncbi:nuclear transport factor 2 family protein [Pollutimonas harenae]